MTESKFKVFITGGSAKLKPNKIKFNKDKHNLTGSQKY